MSTIAFILLARAVHVIAGVVWAGATFVLASLILPMARQYAAEGVGRWTGMMARKVGPVSGISAVLTILSGMYLFAVLHPQDTTMGGTVLKAGAIAALLSFAVGVFVGRPNGLKLAKLSAEHPTAADPGVQQQMATLGRRVALSSHFTIALLGLAVLAMALFRYVQAI